jgi:hypothetical protein
VGKRLALVVLHLVAIAGGIAAGLALASALS